MIELRKNQFDKVVVYYSNILARLKNKFTLEEEKVFHLILSQIKLWEKNPTIFKLSKADFFEKLGLNGNSKYERYKTIVGNLVKKTFIDEIKDSDGSNLLGFILTSSKWNSNKSYFEIDINPRFMPFLEKLIADYTQLNLESVLKFNTKNTLNLYKYFCSWTDYSKGTGTRWLTTKELKDLFNLTKDSYLRKDGHFNRSDFERRTLNVCINKINELSNMNVKWEKKFQNKKVIYYDFVWEYKEEYMKKLDDLKKVALKDKKAQSERFNIFESNINLKN